MEGERESTNKTVTQNMHHSWLDHQMRLKEGKWPLVQGHITSSHTSNDIDNRSLCELEKRRQNIGSSVHSLACKRLFKTLFFTEQ